MPIARGFARALRATAYAEQVCAQRSARRALHDLHRILRDDHAESEHLFQVFYEVRLPAAHVEQLVLLR